MAAVFSWNIRDAGHCSVFDFKNALVFGEDFVFGANSSRKFSMLLGEFLQVGRNVENAADAEVGVFAAEIKTVGIIANPSKPSVKFTALLDPTITKYVKITNPTIPNG